MSLKVREFFKNYGIITLFFLVLLFLFSWLAKDLNKENIQVPTTENRGESGLYALFKYLKEKEVDVHSWRKPLRNMNDTIPDDAVLIISGTALTITFEEWKALENWVESGGRLIFNHSFPSVPTDSIFRQLDFSTHWVDFASHDIDTVDASQFMFSLDSLFDQVLVVYNHMHKNLSNKDTILISMGTTFDFLSNNQGYVIDPDEDGQILLDGPKGSFIFKRNVGEGSVEIMTLPAFSNQLADNEIMFNLAMDYLFHQPETNQNNIYFDDYHLGLVHNTSLSDFMWDNGYYFPFMVMILAFCGLVFFRGLRIAPPVRFESFKHYGPENGFMEQSRFYIYNNQAKQWVISKVSRLRKESKSYGMPGGGNDFKNTGSGLETLVKLEKELKGE